MPPYHCMFNAIEMIWGVTKNYYNKHIGRDGNSIEHCLAMWQEALRTATPEVWSNCITHTEKTIHEWWDRTLKFDREDITPIIITANTDSDSEWSTDSD